MSNEIASSAFLCLKMLVGQLGRDVNMDALVTDERLERFAQDDVATLIETANTLSLRPEQMMLDLENLPVYNGPVMLRLKDSGWIIVQKLHQLTGDGVIAMNPMINKTSALRIKASDLVEKLDGTALLFRNLQQVDVQENTALFCLCSIGRHHNVSMDIRRVLHDYAIAKGEPSENQIVEIASEYQFKAKGRTLSWSRLVKLNDVFPMMCQKTNGKWLMVCGIKRNEEEDTVQVVVIDPENPDMATNRFEFLSQEEFEQRCTYRMVLVKRVYKLTDENRPFGLAWFIPEFLKLKGIWGQIVLIVVMITLLSIVVPLFFQIVVDKVLVNKSYNTLNVLGIGIIVAVLFNGALEYLKSYFLLFATNKIDIATATKTFKHLMSLPIEFFERMPSGVLLKHMQQTEKIRGFLSGNLFFTFLDLLTLAIFLPLLACYSGKLTMLVIGFSLLMALVIACMIRPFQARLNELYQAEGKRQSMLVESIHGVRTVKSLSLEPVEETQWNDSTAYAIKSYFRVGQISMAARAISQVLEMLMTISVVWVGAYLVFEYKLSVGALIAFQMLAGRVTGPLVKMVGLIHEYQQIALSVKMLGQVMNHPKEPMGGGVRNPLHGDISFEDITFRYRPDLPNVIKHFNLEIPRGSMIGIVGRSGSGKTTITKLLQGLYPLQQGIIKIDGIDIREIDTAHLRSSIGVVLQENYFFSGTVRENIALTKRNATLEEIIYVSKLAGADSFVQQLPRGYDTVLEENASNLSGGQKQRLAIARALLTNPSILIFDEATSALDPESEFIIQQNLRQIAKGRTVLIVSHRLSIVSRADKILVIDSGERIAYDTHDVLLSRPGTYKEFWEQQMGPAITPKQGIDLSNYTLTV